MDEWTNGQVGRQAGKPTNQPTGGRTSGRTGGQVDANRIQITATGRAASTEIGGREVSAGGEKSQRK